MIRRFLARLFRRPPEIRREATVLLTMHESTQHGWIAARDRREPAQRDARWSEDRELQRLSRYWNGVMREIERQSGYAHQPDTATRYLESNERERRRRKREEAAARRKPPA